MRKLLTGAAWLMIAGCTQPTRPAAQPAVYDFGLIPSPTAAAPFHLRLAGIKASPGLDRVDMRYRLAYKDPSRVYAYTASRWAAPPAALLTQRLQQRMALEGAEQDACLLRLELESFDQVFDTPQTSRAIVRLRAIVSDPQNRAPVLRQDIVAETPANSADAQGGVAALTAAADDALAQVSGFAYKAGCRAGR